MNDNPKIPFLEKARIGFVKFSVQTYATLREWDLSDEQVKALSTRLELFAVFLLSQNYFATFDNPIANFVLTALLFICAIWMAFFSFVLKGFKK